VAAGRRRSRAQSGSATNEPRRRRNLIERALRWRSRALLRRCPAAIARPGAARRGSDGWSAIGEGYFQRGGRRVAVERWPVGPRRRANPRRAGRVGEPSNGRRAVRSWVCTSFNSRRVFSWRGELGDRRAWVSAAFSASASSLLRCPPPSGIAEPAVPWPDAQRRRLAR